MTVAADFSRKDGGLQLQQGQTNLGEHSRYGCGRLFLLDRHILEQGHSLPLHSVSVLFNCTCFPGPHSFLSFYSISPIKKSIFYFLTFTIPFFGSKPLIYLLPQNLAHATIRDLKKVYNHRRSAHQNFSTSPFTCNSNFNASNSHNAFIT